MKDITVAIDGFSSTGKSTLAKAIAKELSFIYVDTGSMYRAVTLYAMRENLVGDGFFKRDELIEKLDLIEVIFKFNKVLNKGEVYLNGEKVEKLIRTLKVSNHVSTIAAVPQVRKKLVEQQKKLGAKGGLVMDGRDIGTVVFPDAEVKFFMTASAEVRANRRYKELLERGDQISYEEVYDNVVNRDRLDSSRKDSPLVKAEDAIEFDNSNMTINQQLEAMLEIIAKKKSN